MEVGDIVLYNYTRHTKFYGIIKKRLTDNFVELALLNRPEIGSFINHNCYEEKLEIVEKYNG